MGIPLFQPLLHCFQVQWRVIDQREPRSHRHTAALPVHLPPATSGRRLGRPAVRRRNALLRLGLLGCMCHRGASGPHVQAHSHFQHGAGPKEGQAILRLAVSTAVKLLSESKLHDRRRACRTIHLHRLPPCHKHQCLSRMCLWMCLHVSARCALCSSHSLAATLLALRARSVL
jgi:hypothetical protein